MNFFNKILSFFRSGSERTKGVKKNVFFSFLNKGISIIISFLLVTMTIKYVDKEQYGIWLAISSVVSWISFLDFGLAHGLRNKFAEAKSLGNTQLAQKYVSTTYFVLSIIFGITCVIGIVANRFLDWGAILNISPYYNPILTKVFYILISCFSIQFILNILNTIIVADQRPAFAAFLSTLGQFLVLTTIVIMLATTEGSLVKLSLAISVVPCILYFILTFILYSKRYKVYSPSVSGIKLSLIKDILSLGGKFFLIQLSMILIFQIINIIIVRVLGPESVTLYNVSYKLFSTVYMATVIIITPLWSAFTDAYTQKDFKWMQSTYNRISKIWFVFIPISFVILALSPWIFKLWVGDNVNIPMNISLAMVIYVLLLSRSNLSMFLINGTGKLMIQMIIYISGALISIPLMILFSRNYGIIGILLVLSTVSFAQTIFGEMQVRKIIKNNATGIWNK